MTCNEVPYDTIPHRTKASLAPARPSEPAASKNRLRHRGSTEESQRRAVDKVIRRHCVKPHHHRPLELEPFGPPLPSTSIIISPQDEFYLPPISPDPSSIAHIGTPLGGHDGVPNSEGQRGYHPHYGHCPSHGARQSPVIPPKTPCRYRQQCTPSNRALNRHQHGGLPSRDPWQNGQRTPGGPHVEARRGSLGSCEKYRHQYSDGLSGGNRRDRSALKASPMTGAPRVLPRELPPLDLGSLPCTSPPYLVLDTPAVGWMMTPKSGHGTVWTPVERPPSIGVNSRPVPSTVDTIVEDDDDEHFKGSRSNHNTEGTSERLSPPKMSLSPSPSSKHPPPAEVHVSGVIELGPEARFVQSPAKRDDEGVSDSAVMFRSPGEGHQLTRRRRAVGRGVEGPSLAPGLCIDTSLEEDDDATATPLPPTSKKQAEMFSLDDTGGHLRLSRLSKEGLDATVILAEKDMSWLGESPTDTENSDCDEAQAAARARSPTGRHFHVWEVGGKTAKRGGDRPRREARKERKGRVVQQFRRAVYEHQHAEELAKRKVLMESLSSSAGVVDVINLKKGESVKSRMPTMVQGGWVRGKALGSGTAATVYLAKRSVDGFLFVAKEVPLPGKDLLWSDLSRDMRRGFGKREWEATAVVDSGNEAIVLSRARHIEGVVEFFGCEIIADKFYIYMEYLGGGTLASLAPSSPSKRLPERQAARYLRKVLRTLQALHHGSGGLMGSREGMVLALEDRGQLITPIMHRDVKGSNCLLSADRRTVKLCDFGSCTRPRPFSIAGTPLAAGGEKLNASIDLTADIPPDCCAIMNDCDKVIGFAPLESTFTREGEAEGQSGVVMESSLSTSEVLQANSAERRYADPQFFFKSMKGTLLWMAPETLGGSEYSAKVDVWSIGCLLIEMVCGRDPWKEFDNEIQAMHEIWTARDKTPMHYIPAEVLAQCSSSCLDFIQKAVQRDPEARPTCAELLQHPFIENNR